MRVRRLTWAGFEIAADDGSLVIDLLEDASSFTFALGEPADELVPAEVASGAAAAAAVTHIHPDHFDPGAIRRVLAPDAPVLCPVGMDEAVAACSLEPRAVDEWETVTIAGLSVTAVPAVDSVGDPQVSWIVTDGDEQLIHCGDTMFHGYWWEMAERHGPFQLAAVPINGVRMRFPGKEPPSGLPAVMTPEQAAAAAQILGAREACPIHYGTFDGTDYYQGFPDAEASFSSAAAERGVAVRLLRPGETFEPSAVV